MQMTLIPYPKPRNSDAVSFCGLVKRAWDDIADDTQGPVFVIHCTASSAEEIVPYMDEHYSEVNYGVSIIPKERVPEGEIELKDGDLELARDAVKASSSAMWATETVVRHGVPRLRAEKAVRKVFEELREEGNEDKEEADGDKV